MRRSKFLKIALFVIVLCGVFFAAPRFVLSASAADLPDDAVVIGFIDSGISTCHLDASHVLEGKNYAFPEHDTVDRIGHGTQTAGMVLGSAEQGVEGTFPAAYAVPLVVVDKYPSGATKDGGVPALTAAIYDAVDLFGCDIINISLSTTTNSEELKKAVDYAYGKGVIVVASVSNNRDTGGSCYYPAHYDHVIAVGAADGDAVASFSQIVDADFFYQGRSLMTVSCEQDSAAVKDSGTSFSTASVTGICASLLAEDPQLDLAQIKGILHLETYCPSSGFIPNPIRKESLIKLSTTAGRQ